MSSSPVPSSAMMSLKELFTGAVSKTPDIWLAFTAATIMALTVSGISCSTFCGNCYSLDLVVLCAVVDLQQHLQFNAILDLTLPKHAVEYDILTSHDLPPRH